MTDSDKRDNFFRRAVKAIKEGDRTIWMILVLLVMISTVAIFSSTSTLSAKLNVSRFVIFGKHIVLVMAGMALVVLINTLGTLKLLRSLSSAGFIVSLALLLILALHIRIGNVVRAECINHAWRSVRIMGISFSVYEITKIAMVMYLAWAVQAYGSGSFRTAEKLGEAFPERLGWLKSAVAQRWIYIFGPLLITTVLILTGSTGSAIMTCLVMFVTVLISGMKWKYVLRAVGVAAAGAFLVLSIHVASNGKVMDRMQTAFNRMSIELPYPNPQARRAQKDAIAAKNINIDSVSVNSKEFEQYRNLMLQPKAAELAVVQGGRRIIGKGPGKSTQRYKVPVMYEDYMFSLLVEEYGFVACIIVVLYLSLFARGMIIVHNSTNRFAKGAVGGLSFLITFQALFHILVNCGVGVVTGQTLPLISHGKFSFLCFCAAFGIILSISVLVNKKIRRQQEEEAKRIENEVDQQLS